MEKTKKDENSIEEAIAQLDPETMEKVDDLPADSPLFQALHAVMIMLQKPKDQLAISKEIG